jgi:hypothetical protein
MRSILVCGHFEPTLEAKEFIPLTRRNSVMNETLKSLAVVGASLVTSFAAAAPNPATDARIDPQVRAFLAEINKDNSPFWELPQPKPQDILTALQSQTPVDTVNRRAKRTPISG